MDDKVYENYMQAGKIASEAREYGIKLIKSGARLLEVANKIELKIIENGAGISFPVNISINNIAAHYSPRTDDQSSFRKGDVVKLDVGTHFEGYIADTATTIEIETNKYKEMIKASSEALDCAINHIKAGVSPSEIGANIEKTINSFGFKPIDNLTGHGLKRYQLHSGISVPNVGSAFSRYKPKAGDVLAIEPFATDGGGHIISGEGSNIYICEKTQRYRFVRDRRLKMIFDKIKNEFKTLPFAQRWTDKIFPNSDMILRRLSHIGLIKHFPQLVEINDGTITQKEHTVIVTEEGCEVTTI